MNTKKRLLALILVLAMSLTLVPFAMADDDEDLFTDWDAVKNEEAVSVLSGLNVIRGYPDGTFGPTRTITRAEAAVIIARLVLGPALTDILPAGVSGFVDVPASHWASGAIAWCAAEGYVVGIGNNRFNPSGQLTAVQFLIMLM